MVEEKERSIRSNLTVKLQSIKMVAEKERSTRFTVIYTTVIQTFKSQPNIAAHVTFKSFTQN